VANLAVTQVSIVIAGRRGVSSSDLNPVLSVVPGPEDRSAQERQSRPLHDHGASGSQSGDPTAPSNGERMGFGSSGPGPAVSGGVDYLYAVGSRYSVRRCGRHTLAQPGSTFAGRVKLKAPHRRLPRPRGPARRVLPPGGTYDMTSATPSSATRSAPRRPSRSVPTDRSPDPTSRLALTR
jgi:hypothetical protein